MEQTADHTEARFTLEGSGLGLDSGWTELREYIDVVVKALRAMSSGPLANELIPISVTAGSLCVAFRMPTRALPAVDRLRAGPTPDWTPSEFDGASSLWSYLRAKNATLKVQHKNSSYEIELPPASPDVTLSERFTCRALVYRVGGKDGTAELQLDGSRQIERAAVGRELAGELAHYLYQHVLVEGSARRSLVGDKRQNLEITRVVGIGKLKPAAEAFAELHLTLKNSLSNFDVEAFLLEARQ